MEVAVALFYRDKKLPQNTHPFMLRSVSPLICLLSRQKAPKTHSSDLFFLSLFPLGCSGEGGSGRRDSVYRNKKMSNAQWLWLSSPLDCGAGGSSDGIHFFNLRQKAAQNTLFLPVLFLSSLLRVVVVVVAQSFLSKQRTGLSRRLSPCNVSV